MNTELIKKKIIELAISGKLVEQRPEEGSAEDLYNQIQEEKKRLIAEGKIRKEKPLPDISEDEIPFEIPASWKWVRLGDIGSWSAGATPSRLNHEFYGGDIPWLKTGDLNDSFIDNIPEFITNIALKKTSVRLNPVGSVLIAMYGATIGKLGILKVPATTNQACCACICFNGVFNKYLFYYLLARRSSFIGQAMGGAQPNISKEKIVCSLFAIPPLAEQKRIVDKVEEIFSRIDVIEKTKADLAKDGNLLEKKILDLAIRGKLVEQRPEEGTAEELYSKTKVEKNLPSISEEEIPFDIPQNWKWIKLGNICSIARGASPRPIKAFITSDVNGVNWIKIGDTTEGNKYIKSAEEKITQEGSKKSRFVHSGDFLLTNSMSFGHPYILDIDGCVHDGWLILSNYADCYDKIFLYYLLSSSFAYIQFSGAASGSTVKNLNSVKVANSVFPLPPLAEQKRIVAKIEELLPYCEKLK